MRVERLNGAAPARKTSLRAIFSQPEYVYSWAGWRNLVFVVSGLMALASLFLVASLGLRRGRGAPSRDGDAYAPLAASAADAQ